MCASHITEKRCRNSGTAIQNSPSFWEREASSSLSLSLNAFHSQLRSDQAPPHTPPHSPPAQGLRSLMRFVSKEPPLIWDESEEVVRMRARPVMQYGCSESRPERLCLVPLSVLVIARRSVDRGTAPPRRGPLGGTLWTTAPVKSWMALPMEPYFKNAYPPYNLWTEQSGWEELIKELLGWPKTQKSRSLTWHKLFRATLPSRCPAGSSAGGQDDLPWSAVGRRL